MWLKKLGEDTSKSISGEKVNLTKTINNNPLPGKPSMENEIKNHANQKISDSEFMEIRKNCAYHNVPLTKEEALYRKIFWSHYGTEHDHLISEIWRPKWTNITDPSARLLIEKNPK